MKFPVFEKKPTLKIAIEGTIAAGKTSLIKSAVQLFGTDVVHPVLENINMGMLALFNEDPERYAYVLQMNQLNACRWKMLKAIASKRSLVLVDRSTWGNSAFELVNYESGNITEKEHKVYLSMLEHEKLDAIVYLKVSPKTALNRIMNVRKRPEESGLTLEYMESLERTHDRVLNEASKTIPVISVDWEKFGSFKRILSLIENAGKW